ncbi:MAG: cob(I)yrinic acid a,c-diamide adenosyltransferase [Ruminococcus sp.]|nr:cob(I)yrinic acid a,c-diamide adenosyltransferase [Ruminococcus sp.]
MIHIISGDGRGKTTSAAGLAVRAAGAGMRVAFFQFMKDGSSSEITVLRSVNGITVRCCEVCRRFIWEMDEREKEAVVKEQDLMLKEAKALISDEAVDMLVLDEFFSAYNTGTADKSLAEDIVLNCPESTELVLTGRDPAEVFCAAADYHSEIRSVKHPYDRGVSARKGIEY